MLFERVLFPFHWRHDETAVLQTHMFVLGQAPVEAGQLFCEHCLFLVQLNGTLFRHPHHLTVGSAQRCPAVFGDQVAVQVGVPAAAL